MQANAQGLTVDDILKTLNVYQGDGFERIVHRFAKSIQIVVPTDDKFVKRPPDLEQLQLRNNKGQIVRLSSVATVRASEESRAISRLDLQPMVEITANPVAGVSPAQIRMVCDTAFAELRRELKLAAEYRLTWLQDVP